MSNYIKECTVTRLVSWPTLVGGIVMTTVLAPLAPTTGKPAQAQFAIRIGGGFYSPYGQGPYGGYGPGAYGGYGQPYGGVYDPGYGGPFNPRWGAGYGRGIYGYSGYGNTPYRHGYSYGYRSSPYTRFDGRSTYYQPYYQPPYGRVYAPFGYERY